MTEYTRDMFFKSYEEICNSAADTLFHKGMDLFDKLTPEERIKLSSGQFSMRLPKIVLVAVSDCIPDNYTSEIVKPEIAKAKKINKRR